MTYKILNLFPKPLLIVDNICRDQLSLFESIINDIMIKMGTKSTQFQHVNSTHVTFPNLYEIRQFEPLVREIQNHSHIFLTELGFSDDEISKLRLNTMWANKSRKGDYLFPHIHSNSIISGAFYIKSAPEDTIHFYQSLEDSSYVPSIESEYSKRWKEIDCVPGRLLIFKSNLPHGNSIKDNDLEKIVISFNIGFNTV